MIGDSKGGQMALTADAVVVGGGVIGASTLFHLCAFGARRVILCERREPGAGASGKSGAFIQLHFCLNLPEVELTLASLPYFHQWADLVGAGSCGFVPAGYLRLEPPEREAKLRAQVALLQPLGVETSAIEPDEIARLAPYLRLDGVAAAAYEPTSGYADANATLTGFLTAAEQRGGEVLAATTVTAVRVVGGKMVGVETTAGPIDAPIVVLAAGAWSPPLLRDLGLSVPIEGALTQWLGFAVPSLPQEMMTVGEGISGSYFRATTPGAREVLIGLGGMGRQPLGDPDTDTGSIPNALVALAGERLAARLVGADGARFTGGQIGPVTLTPDDLPIIDRHPGVDGLFYFAGDCGSSFKTAPAIGRAFAEWALLGSSQSVDVAPFGLGRFAGRV